MTRPFRRFHDHSSQIGRYLQKGGNWVAGSVLEEQPGALMRWFKPYEMPFGEGLLHTTLSLPPDRTLSDADWQEISCMVLARTGIPPSMAPWFTWGREDTHCDHVHIVSTRQTWTGRPLELSVSRRDTDRLSIDLAHTLGLPEPHWAPPGTSLLGHIRKGVLSTARSFADDLNRAMDFRLPSSIGEANAALSAIGNEWQLQPSDDPDGLLLPLNIFTGQQVNPSAAGPDFGSAHLAKRFALAKEVGIMRAEIVLQKLARLLPVQLIPNLERAKSNDRSEDRGRNSVEQARRDKGGHQTPLPAPGHS